MRKVSLLFIISMLALVLAACNGEKTEKPEEDNEQGEEHGDEHGEHGDEDEHGDMDGMLMLEVDFEVPETVKVGETAELKATVTYDGEPVVDADEVMFEVWKTGDRDNADKIDGENHQDGTYSIKYKFTEVSDYEMYAHTTAHHTHTMPKKMVSVVE